MSDSSQGAIVAAMASFAVGAVAGIQLLRFYSPSTKMPRLPSQSVISQARTNRLRLEAQQSQNQQVLQVRQTVENDMQEQEEIMSPKKRLLSTEEEAPSPHQENGLAKYSTHSAERSTTSGAIGGGGISTYETNKAVNEYLLFHFGRAKDILPYEDGPKDALDFVSRCTRLAEKHCGALRDFTGETGESCALDIGCAVGGAAFELARYFDNVVGIDYSNQFIAAAQELKADGRKWCTIVEEGDITRTITVEVPHDIDRSRVKFMQGDACNLPEIMPKFDAILAANLLCRLPDPMMFLQRLPELAKRNGIVVLVSPYSWLSDWTPKSNWLGGYYKNGEPMVTRYVLADIMTKMGFELREGVNLPFLIREHSRKYQWGCSHATVWKKC